MNKLLTKVAKLALGLSLAAGVGVAIGRKVAEKVDASEEVAYTLDCSVAGSGNSYTGNNTATVNGVGWKVNGNVTMNPWRIGNGKSGSAGTRLVQSQAAVSTHNITKIVITTSNVGITPSAVTLKVGTSAGGSNTTNTSVAFSTPTITINRPNGTDWSSKFFEFGFTIGATASKYFNLNSIVFYYEATGTVTYSVIYDLNGGTGTSNIPSDSNEYTSGAEVTVLGIGDVTKSGYTFINWSDGTNTYDAGDHFYITGNTTLTAQWYHNDSISANSASYELYNGETLNLSNCVTASGDGALSFTVPSVNYLTYDSSTTIITADSTNTGGPLSITANKGTANCTFTVTVTAAPQTGTFELFSGTITDGRYVIASDTTALKAEISNKRGAYETISPNGNDEVVNPAPNLVWEISAATIGGKTGFTIYNAAGGYLSSTNSDGNATLLANASSKSVWAASGSGSYEFVNQDPKTATKANLRLNPGYGFACYNTGTGKALTLYKIDDSTITAARLTAGTVSASTGDTEWTLEDFVFEVQYNNQSTWYEIDNSYVTYTVNIAVPTITQNDTVTVTVTGTYGDAEATASNISATLTYLSPYTLYSIERLYSATLNQTYDADGVYMGEVADGYIFMNGAYGILAYNNQHSLSLSVGTEYTIHGKIKEYSGLLEFDYTGTTVTEIVDADRIAGVLTPVTYEVQGNESDKTLANRKTELTGYVKSMSSTAQNADSTVVFNVNGHDVTVYVKAAEATQKNMTALQGNMTANNGLSSNFVLIDLEGFTGWHNGFQVSLTKVVVADENYTIYDFSRGLLKETLHVCTGGDHDNTTNKAALVAIWDELKGASYYGNLTEQRKADLAAGTANSAISVPATSAGIDEMSDSDALGAALYRYDFCTAKYDLEEFIVGRTLSVSFGNNISLFGGNTETTTTITLIVIISMVSVTAIGGYFFIRRRKAN